MAKTPTDSDREAAKALVSMTEEWKRLQRQRQRASGGPEGRMLTALAMYYGEHLVTQFKDTLQSRAIKDADRNRLSLVFNMLQKATKKRIGHLYRVDPDFSASPNQRDSRAWDKADVVNDLLRGIDLRLRERTLQWKRLWYCCIFGVALEHTPWVEDATQDLMPQFDEQSGELLWRYAKDDSTLPQSAVEELITSGQAIPEHFDVLEEAEIVGDVGAQVLCPLNFFIDASVPLIADLPSDQGCFIVEVKTKGFLADTFGSNVLDGLASSVGADLGIIRTRLLDKGPSMSGINMTDLVPAVQGSRGPNDPEMYLCATRYQGSCKNYPQGRRTIFVPGQAILDDGPCYNGEIPVTDLHYDAPTVGFWTPDFVTQMIPAQKFFNKRMSQMGESANATIHEVLLLGGTLSKEDIPSDLPGVVPDGLDESGNPQVQVLQRGILPGWFLESTLSVQKWIESVSASDLTQGQGQFTQIRGPLAIPILQELIDSEDGPFYHHMGEQIARIKQLRVNRVKEFYPPIRTLHYTGRGHKDETLVFHTDEVLRTGTDFTIIVDRGTLVPELSALRRARVLEDLNSPLAILYTNRRTGKIDASLIAASLKYQDRAIEERGVQYRKLAQALITRLWKGQVLPPEIPYAFWDHNTLLDELEASMVTTEWLEASEPVKQGFIALYERSRDFLAAIQGAQQDAMQSTMMQGAMAQASQQAAAKAASVATDAALSQVQISAQMAKSPQSPLLAGQAGAQAQPGLPGGPVRPDQGPPV